MHGGCIIIHGGLDKPRVACRIANRQQPTATTAMMIPRGMACYDSPFNSITIPFGSRKRTEIPRLRNFARYRRA
jgi:hypothetical protein